jgi:hypothetical protein
MFDIARRPANPAGRPPDRDCEFAATPPSTGSAVTRHHFKFGPDPARELISGKKTTTIRYVRGAVEVPARPVLPCFRAGGDSNDTSSLAFIGLASVICLNYKEFGELDEADARRDGFVSSDELKSALQEFYGCVTDHELVTVYTLSLLTDVALSG